MTSKKYQFYIDTEPQVDFVKKSTKVKKLSSNDSSLLSSDQEIDELISAVTDLEINTKNEYFKKFCQENNFPENFYNRIIRKYDKILLTFWGVCKLNELENYDFFNDRGLFKSSYEKNINGTLPFIIKFEDKKFINYDKIINYGSDLSLSKDLVNSNKSGLKYQIYVNDRLLIERFFPEDLPMSKILCEESILNFNSPVKVKLVSNYKLIFSKIAVNGAVNYPNSTEFILEP